MPELIYKKAVTCEPRQGRPAAGHAHQSRYDDLIRLFEPLDNDHLSQLTTSWLNLWVTETQATDQAIDAIDTVDIKVNRRLKRSLGICRPTNALIGLNPILLHPTNKNLLEETLCHELAHVMTWLRFGRQARPHGPEWAELMYLAGFRARAQIPSHEIAGYVPTRGKGSKRSRTRYEYEHYCPACDAVMTAMRTSYRWRCAPCLSAGRSGELTVTRRPV